jgi:hypothetical protein
LKGGNLRFLILKKNIGIEEHEVSLKSGDKNTIFFHKFVEFRKNFNTIWDIEDLEGNI